MPEQPLITTSSTAQRHSAKQGAWQIIPTLLSPPPQHRDPTHQGMQGNRWIFHGKELRLLLPVKHVSSAEPCVQNIKPAPFARTAALGEGFGGYSEGNAPQHGTRRTGSVSQGPIAGPWAHHFYVCKQPGFSSSRCSLSMGWSNGKILNCIEAAVISQHNGLPSLALVSKSLDKVYRAYKANTFRRLFIHSASHWGYFRPKPVQSIVLDAGRSQS